MRGIRGSGQILRTVCDSLALSERRWVKIFVGVPEHRLKASGPNRWPDGCGSFGMIQRSLGCSLRRPYWRSDSIVRQGSITLTKQQWVTSSSLPDPVMPLSHGDFTSGND